MQDDGAMSEHDSLAEHRRRSTRRPGGPHRSGSRRSGGRFLAVGSGVLAVAIVVSGVGSTPSVANATTGSASSGAPSSSHGISCATTPASPKGASTVTATAVLNGVSATLSGTAGTQYQMNILEHPSLEITRSGTTEYHSPVALPKGTTALMVESLIDPDSSAPTQPLCVVRFGDNPSPTVLAGFYTGGAHCCTIIRAYNRAGGQWVAVDHVIGDPDVEVEEVEGSPSLVTADDSFSYRFTDYAGSGDPVEVFQVQDGRFVEVTRKYPSVIDADAANWLQLEKQHPSDNLGLLAAWVADECRIGHQDQAYGTVTSLEAQGKLGGLNDGSHTANDPWPTGAAYVKALKSFLTSRRYCSPS